MSKPRVDETGLWEAMMAEKLVVQGMATLTRDVVMRKWQGHCVDPEFVDVPVRAGTRVRVVMASRFGDVGITDDLEAKSGYHYRTNCVVGELAGKRVEPAGLLTDIELIRL